MDRLTEGQIAELTRILLALSKEIEETLEISKDSAKPVDLEQPIGRVSRVDALQQQSMSKASRRNLEIRLRQTKTALVAVNDEEYGDCKECGESIGYLRLKARPETLFCFECQTRMEKRR